MLKKLFCLAVGLALSGCAHSEPGIMYQVLILKDGEKLASPNLVGEFRETVAFEVAGEVRVEMVSEPQEGEMASVIAQIYFPKIDADNPEYRFEDDMALGSTPSFQYTSKSKQYRVEIMPRYIELPPNRAKI